MGLDMRRARHALAAAGGRGAALYWPFGRERRARILLRRRLAVLDAKNTVADLLFKSQAPLADLHLSTRADVARALADPDQRRLILSRALSRDVIEAELVRRPGAELGRALDQALLELVAEGRLLHLPGEELLLEEDGYLAVLTSPQPRYSTAELNRLVREGTSFAAQLRMRSRREETTTGRRSYRL